MRVYIAGPMRGIYLFNFPAFDAAKHRLVMQGYSVVSPADIDRANGFDPLKDLSDDWDWNIIPEYAGTREDIIKRDIDELLTCNAIFLLPGWENSTGARAEMSLARWAGMQVMLDPGTVVPDYTMAKMPVQQPVTNPADNQAIKDSNPKDNIGSKKPGLSAVPCAPLYEAGAALAYGGLKYGRHNWRAIGVRSSVYYDAVLRHLMAWWEGEDIDPVEQGGSGLPHLAHAIAGLMVYRDCEIAGMTTDDRPIRVGNPSIPLNSIVEDIASRYPNPVAPYTEATNAKSR